MNLHKKLTEWQEKQIITAETRQDIERYEASLPRASDYIWRYGLIGLATLCVCLGILFIIAANWQAIPFSLKLGIHLLFNTGVGVYLFRNVRNNAVSWRQVEVPMLILATAQLSLMALIGQYLQISSPIEDVMLFWWILIAPMLLLLGRSSASVVLFFGLGIYSLLAQLDLSYYESQPLIFWIAVISYLLSTLSAIQKHRPEWQKYMRRGGLLAVLLLMTVVLIDPSPSWGARYNDSALFSEATQLYWNVLSNLLLMGVMGVYTHYSVNKYGTRYSFENQIILFALAISAIAPLIHFDVDFVGMVLFCGAFLGTAWISYYHQHIKGMTISIVLIAIRLIIYFASLTDNLLINGIVMIGIGLTALSILKKLVLNKEVKQ